MLDPDPENNPTFARFNHALVPYCDGASFAGDAEEPLVVPVGNSTATLDFRGQRVLREVLRHLARRHELSDATRAL